MPSSVQTVERSLFYGANVDNASISMGVLRSAESADPLFFLGAGSDRYHQLSIDARLPSPSEGFNPLLSRTPGLESLVLLDDGHSVRALRNLPGDPSRLETLTFTRTFGPIPQEAAFYVHSEGESSPIEGRLLSWWEEMTRGLPPQSLSMEEAMYGVRQIGHHLNNTMSGVICNQDASEPALAALVKLFSALSTLPTFQRAFKKGVNSEAAGEAWSEVVDLIPRNLRDAKNPLSSLCAMLEDLNELSEQIGLAADRTVSYVQRVQRRVPTEVPIGASDFRTLLKECEKEEPKETVEVSSVAVPSEPSRVAAPILLVDDDEDVRTLLSGRFSTNGFANVLTAGSLAQALAQAEQVPDLRLIVTDFNLSDTETGLDLIRALSKRIPGLRAVLITGNTEALREELTAEEAAAFDVFPKPLEVSALVERLKTIVKQEKKD